MKTTVSFLLFNSKSFSKYFLMLAMFATFITSGCFKRDPCPEDQYVVDSIPQNRKDILPYKGFDTLVFLCTNTGDTHTFIGTGIINYFNKSTYPLNQECPGGHADLEVYGFKFQSSTLPTPIVVFEELDEHRSTGDFKVIFGTSTFIATLSGFSDLYYSYDSVQIGAKKYFKVSQVYLEGSTSQVQGYTYYNQSFGVLVIKAKDGTQLELVKD